MTTKTNSGALPKYKSTFCLTVGQILAFVTDNFYLNILIHFILKSESIPSKIKYKYLWHSYRNVFYLMIKHRNLVFFSDFYKILETRFIYSKKINIIYQNDMNFYDVIKTSVNFDT